MRKIATHRRRLAAFALAVAFAPLAVVVPAPAAAEPQAPEQRFGEGFSLDEFRLPYERLMAGVESGRVERDTEHKAKALWLSLREDLLALNARIAALMLEAKQLDGPAQERALRELAETAAARERVLGRHVRALEELTRAAPAGGAPPAAGSGGITIDFVPADPLNSGTN